MKLANIIEPIKLLKGSHSDTGDTGQGCFMNVIAYLNGEPQITDQSECVCFVVRPIAIWFNDFLRDDERHILIPFIERAMGSRTEDRKEIERRAWLAVKMAKRMSVVTAKYAYAAPFVEFAAKYATKFAESAKYSDKAAQCTAEYAAKAAQYAEPAAKSTGEFAKYAAKSAVGYAKSAAESAKYAGSAAREEIKAAGLEFLDKSLPRQEQSSVVIERAKQLRELITV